ncbi:MAG: hypothetical protein A2V64_07530 [Bacteroidetes bacterium RBG_13_43_22]|nr:MAG: hypothetical protein A2V64_07530 [Bacteroidetes bacterium RBG_13_43_22]
MTEKETFVFPDQNVKPTEEMIFSFIGNKKILWQKIMKYLSDNYKEASGSWNYYNDGKQWLYKMVMKKKTIFWLAVLKDTFRITFYFGDKAEPVINASDLPKSVKDDFLAGKHYGKIRGITTKINSQSDVETITKLVDIKVKHK